ncbi:MAG: sulfite exporter TauE/SafE family protein [Candidatus Omnitrophica bacterium]|nr:sulfite exporter TauE/SafE family protein [Candidatus Omnitrophota bacterium]
MAILILTAVISLLAGIFSGLLGIGGGLILVPLFHYVLKMNMHLAVGTSLAIIVPTALVGTFRHASGNFVDWRIFIFSVIFAMIGGLIGAGISMNLDVALLRKIFAVFLFLVAVKMFLQ